MGSQTIMHGPLISNFDRRELIQRYGRLVRFDVPLAVMSRWKIGGQADVVISPRNMDELSELRTWIHARGLPSVVIGATSNILFADEGLRALAIQIGSDFSPLHINQRQIVAGPGVWVPGLALSAMRAGLTGLEHTCGIPGTLGGLVYMNGGSQRKGIGDVVSYVKSIDKWGEAIIRSHDECQFAYRASIFQMLDEVIAEVGLSLEVSACKKKTRSTMLSILRERRKKFPQKLPNCGSVFVSDPAMYEKFGPPGKVIEMVGLKGARIGGAVISPKHANFIVNAGQASSTDVIQLIALVRRRVAQNTGYMMRVEAKFLESNGNFLDIESAEHLAPLN